MAERHPDARKRTGQDPPPSWSPIIYDCLRDLADTWMRRERPGHTLQPTALVHEAYIRLADSHDLHIDDRTHFQALAATVMRHVLVDHARRRLRARRGGGWNRVDLADLAGPGSDAVDMLVLHESLRALAAEHDRAARVVELRFFGGLTVEQTAAFLDVSTRTVELDWQFARAWLLRSMREPPP